MTNRIRPALATAAVLALAVAAAPAHAGDRHDGGGGYDVTIPLSKRTSAELRDGANGVIATGKADKWQSSKGVVLSFPVRGDRDGHHRTGGGMALAGGVAFTGAGPNVTWSKLRIGHRGFVSALLGGGDRASILRVAGDRHDGHHRGGSAKLVLTRAGAASLNRAAAGAPFSAGDVFAGGNDCR